MTGAHTGCGECGARRGQLHAAWCSRTARTPLSSADLAQCPAGSLDPAHFRSDGTCRCDEDDEGNT